MAAPDFLATTYCVSSFFSLFALRYSWLICLAFSRSAYACVVVVIIVVVVVVEVVVEHELVSFLKAGFVDMCVYVCACACVCACVCALYCLAEGGLGSRPAVRD